MNFKAIKKQSKLLKLIESFHEVQQVLTQALKMSCGFYLNTAKVRVHYLQHTQPEWLPEYFE